VQIKFTLEHLNRDKNVFQGFMNVYTCLAIVNNFTHYFIWLVYSVFFVYLFQAGEAHLGTDESVFNVVLCTRSYPQLKATFEKYRELTGKGIIDTISREMSGSVKEGFLAIGLYLVIIYFSMFLYRWG